MSATDETQLGSSAGCARSSSGWKVSFIDGTVGVPPRPILVLVSGAPATGKTTLARLLAETLPMPRLAKDDLWLVMADALNVRSEEERRIGLEATFAVYYLVIRQLLAARVSLIAEHNFPRGIAEADLRPCVELARTIMVHCETSRDISVRRFIERYERGERHRVTWDAERVPRLLAGESLEPWERAQPLDLEIPVLRVNTTDGYEPGIEEIIAFIRTVG